MIGSIPTPTSGFWRSRSRMMQRHRDGIAVRSTPRRDRNVANLRPPGRLPRENRRHQRLLLPCGPVGGTAGAGSAASNAHRRTTADITCKKPLREPIVDPRWQSAPSHMGRHDDRSRGTGIPDSRRLRLEDHLRLPELCEAAGCGRVARGPERPLPPLRSQRDRAGRSAAVARTTAVPIGTVGPRCRLADGSREPTGTVNKSAYDDSRSRRRWTGHG